MKKCVATIVMILASFLASVNVTANPCLEKSFTNQESIFVVFRTVGDGPLVHKIVVSLDTQGQHPTIFRLLQINGSLSFTFPASEVYSSAGSTLDTNPSSSESGRLVSLKESSPSSGTFVLTIVEKPPGGLMENQLGFRFDVASFQTPNTITATASSFDANELPNDPQHVTFLGPPESTLGLLNGEYNGSILEGESITIYPHIQCQLDYHYAWDFETLQPSIAGDLGQYDKPTCQSVTFPAAGEYTMKFTIEDSAGQSAHAQVAFRVVAKNPSTIITLQSPINGVCPSSNGLTWTTSAGHEFESFRIEASPSPDFSEVKSATIASKDLVKKILTVASALPFLALRRACRSRRARRRAAILLVLAFALFFACQLQPSLDSPSSAPSPEPPTPTDSTGEKPQKPPSPPEEPSPPADVQYTAPWPVSFDAAYPKLYYRIIGIDKDGNETVSGTEVFRTR